MALFRKFFYRKPPDGLLEISERVYVFDCCFSTDVLEEDDYKGYMGGIVGHLRDHLPDATFMVFNFREGEKQSQIANILSDYDMTVMDYPRNYEGCPLLTMEMIHHFLRSSESWLSLGQQNVLLMHCERGGWPVLAFMLAGLLIYRKQYSGEQKTLDMIYKQAPRELLQLLSPLNPLPSQVRYLHYVSRRNVGSEWPPLDRALTLDCIILRMLPNFDGHGGCRPLFRIYGQDPFIAADRTPKALFSIPKRSKIVRHYRQADCELVKIDIHCHTQGDVVLECISLDEDLEREEMMFRVMFNTAFIRSNILILNRDEIDILWDAKDRFPKDFRTEVLFSEMDTSASIITLELPGSDEKEGLPMEAFAKVQEIFSSVDWLDPKTDAALNALQQITTSHILQEKSDISSLQNVQTSTPSVGEASPDKLQEKLEPTSENDIKSGAAMGLEKQSRHSFKSSALEVQPKSSVKSSALEEQCTPSVKSSALEEQSTSSVKSSALEMQSMPSVKSSALEAQSTPLLKSSLDLEKEEVHHQEKVQLLPQELEIALQQSTQSTIIAQRVPPSFSNPVSYSNSLQGSPLPMTKYHSAPSALSITALFHDHASYVSSEVTHPTKTSPPPPPPPPSPTLSVSSLPKSSSSNIVSPLPQSPPPPPPPPPKLQHSSEVAPLPPPPPPPRPCTLFPAPPIPPTPPFSATTIKTSLPTPPPPPPSPPPFVATSTPPPPIPPPAPSFTSLTPSPPPALMKKPAVTAGPPPPPPPPLPSRGPPPSPPPSFLSKNSTSSTPPAPPPAPPFAKGKVGAPPPPFTGPSPAPPFSAPPFATKGRGLVRSTSPRNQQFGQSKKAALKPLHWLKLTRAMQGSLWDETQRPDDDASKAPEFDMSELESLFSSVPNSDRGGAGDKSNRRASLGMKPEKVQLIDQRKAYNCEIMLSKVKMPLPDLMSSLLALDDSALDIDQVDNLIKFCPTKEDMELLKNYSGDKENLGRCEQFFLELMKVPRVESKLRVFSFKIQFTSQVSDLRKNLNVVNSAAEEIRNSAKLKRIMQTILSLGNALNQGTARGSAIGFRLDSLLKLTDTRARNNKMTLMHYLCKVLADKLPELLDFQKDLISLESASKIQLKYLAEEMQAISKGLEKVEQELTASENDGPVSEAFCKTLKGFLVVAEAKVSSLVSLYAGVGRNADALALYFGEDPARCPFEQVVFTLLNFVRTFARAHEDNCKYIELERKRAQKEAENEKAKISTPRKSSEQLSRITFKSSSTK